MAGLQAIIFTSAAAEGGFAVTAGGKILWEIRDRRLRGAVRREGFFMWIRVYVGKRQTKGLGFGGSREELRVLQGFGASGGGSASNSGIGRAYKVGRT